ncbi:M23 family metallopeptidase [Bosea sp. AAP35]|uniref:M23 family metallopeptidase n=1 Tax=Bosea sp. AAP35 TaxID=1523417 RepID=UPI0009E7F12A|nr:M23 family metallopeptidase [Bosea sp. AAP35]
MCQRVGDVKADEIVPPGAIIGRLASTGRSTGPRLHYETRLAGEASNPLKFIETGTWLSQPALPAR